MPRLLDTQADQHMATMPTLLIIGGTGEARQLAHAAACIHGTDLRLITSRLGLVKSASPPAGDMRQGRFGGVAGLVAYLNGEGVDWVIDASHPFAQTISDNARAACQATGCAYVRLARPAWHVTGENARLCFPTLTALCAALPQNAKRVFLTLGTQGTDGFAQAYRRCRGIFHPNRQWLIRVATPPEQGKRQKWMAIFGPTFPLLSPRWRGKTGGSTSGFSVLVQKGPFTFAREANLMRRFGVDCLITKMSGGAATRSKMSAAHQQNIPCLLLERPQETANNQVSGVAGALEWLARHRTSV